MYDCRNGNYSTEKYWLTHELILLKYWILYLHGLIENTRSIYICSKYISNSDFWAGSNNNSIHLVHFPIEQHTLPELYKRLDIANEKLWINFMKNDSHSLQNTLSLSLFQYVLVVQAFKPGCLYSQLTNFVQQVLGTITRSMTN